MASSQFVGKAGHLATMGEFALRGYNIAIPEIDIGDDIFAVNSTTGAMWRVQAKTAIGRRQKKSTAFRFSIRESAVVTSMTPELHFIFAMRFDDSWKFLIVSRSVLANYQTTNTLGSAYKRKTGTYYNYSFTVHDTGKVTSAGIDLSHHLTDWGTWPAL